MSAFRFIEQFSKAGFLEEEHEGLRVVRIEELITAGWRQTRGASLKLAFAGFFAERRTHYGTRSGLTCTPKKAAPPCRQKDHRCSSAAGVSRVICRGGSARTRVRAGVQPYLYIERMEPGILETLGFSASSVDVDPDVYIRVPRNDESVFRARGSGRRCPGLRRTPSVARRRPASVARQGAGRRDLAKDSSTGASLEGESLKEDAELEPFVKLIEALCFSTCFDLRDRRILCGFQMTPNTHKL